MYLQPGEAPVYEEQEVSPDELRKLLAEVVAAT